MGALLQDIRYALRVMRTSPVFTAVALLSLALGIGANTSIFSLIDKYLLESLAVPHPEQLVTLYRVNSGGTGESFDYGQFERFRDGAHSVAGIFGFAYRQIGVGIGGRTEPALVQLASPEYFSTLEIQPVAGRAFTANDASTPLAVISYDFWKRKFALDPAALGKSVVIKGTPYQIVGITAPGFYGVSLDYAADVWIPLILQPQVDGNSMLEAAGPNWVRVMGRLRPGTSLEQATADLKVLFQPVSASGIEAQRLQVVSADRPISGARPILLRPLVMLMAIVGIVLLIACANLANLLLAKASARQREITVRVAVGASRGRIIRQLLTESILLALLGGGLGVFVAMWGSDVLLAMMFVASGRGPAPLPLQFHADLRMLAFTALASLLAGTLFGLTPALRVSRTDLFSSLRGRRGGRLHKTLVGFQLATSLLLLIAAGLFVRSFSNLANVDLGFDSAHILQVRIDGPQTYDRWDQVFEKLSSLPGTVSTSACLPGLFNRINYFTNVAVEGVPARGLHGEADLDIALFVGPEYFKTMGMPFLIGRSFTRESRGTQADVAVINETMARTLFGAANPVGKVVTWGPGSRLVVVGVVRDAKYNSVLAPARPTIYTPLAQFHYPSPTRFVEMRTAADPGSFATAVSQAVQALDGNLNVKAQPMQEVVAQSLTLQRFNARLTAFFGFMGLLLASIGVYGVMSYVAAQRTAEMGIRAALGARPRALLWLVMRESMTPVIGGLGAGLALALAFTRLVSSQLFGLSANDPSTIAIVTLIMAAIAGLAVYIPAQRAIRTDPMSVLRYE